MRLRRNFPASGVGKNWTSHFISKHSDWLSTYWTHNLDEKWGWAVNPHTNKEWFDLLEDVLKGNRDSEFDDPPPSPTGAGSQDQDDDNDGNMPALVSLEKDTYGDDGVDEDNNAGHEPIQEENIYRTDKSGFFPEGGVRVCVIGARGTKTQHQQSDGGRENTTVIVMICTDGTLLKPFAHASSVSSASMGSSSLTSMAGMGRSPWDSPSCMRLLYHCWELICKSRMPFAQKSLGGIRL